jgi:hypothetical protein
VTTSPDPGRVAGGVAATPDAPAAPAGATAAGATAASATAAARLDADQRRTFAGLADVLIPAGGGLPSASGAGCAGEPLDRVLAVRPDLTDALAALLTDAAGRDPEPFVAELRDTDPERFALLAVAVPGAYFLDPEIRASFGYHGQEAIPIDADAAPDHDEDGMLAEVVARGPIYRETR